MIPDDELSGKEPWLMALDRAVDARDRLRALAMIGFPDSRAQLARHDLARALDTIIEGAATMRIMSEG